jgi:MOSC domain-containing protein YiiM
MPRTPCNNLSARVGIHRFHHRFAATGRVGAYLSVISPGTVTAGDIVRLEHRPDHGVTIADWFVDRTAEKAQRLLASGVELADDMKHSAVRVVRRPRS